MMNKFFGVFLLIVFFASVSAYAQPSEKSRQIITVSNAAGSCAMMKRAMELADQSETPEDQLFIIKLQQAEAARLGKTVDDYLTQCDKAINVYEGLWQFATQR